jgi:DNA-binding HxlR family transcriptional regulator
MIERRVIPETPVRVEYLLTEKGHALSGVMDAISAWATEWHDDAPDDAHACPAERAAQANGARRRG